MIIIIHKNDKKEKTEAAGSIFFMLLATALNTVQSVRDKLFLNCGEVCAV